MMMPTSGPSSTIWHCPALTQLLRAGSFRVRILARQSRLGRDDGRAVIPAAKYLHFQCLESRYVPNCRRKSARGAMSDQLSDGPEVDRLIVEIDQLRDKVA